MSKKNITSETKLLCEGRRLLIEKGASNFSLREVADAAKVNLGMFNYYFGSKDKFIELILTDIYDDFLSKFELTPEEDTLETLEKQLFLIAQFARDNRSLILVLISDILSGEKSVQRFARLKMKKHFIILAKTIKGCQKKKLLIEAPLPLILTQIVGGIGLSNLILEFLKKLGVSKVFDLGLKKVIDEIITDEAIKLRVTIALKGFQKN